MSAQKTNTSDSVDRNPENLYNEAMGYMREEKWEEAADLFSEAINILQTTAEEKKQDSEQIEFAEYYLQYGKALLETSKSQTDPFAIMVDEEDDNEDDDHENNNDQPEEEIEQNEETKDDNATENGAEKEVDDSKDEASKNSDAEHAKTENEDAADEYEDEDVDDFDLAWESLETARGIIQKFLSENPKSDKIRQFKLKLAEVHILLGEFLMEKDGFQQALEEFDSALTLKLECKDTCRELAYTYFMASMCACHAADAAVSKKYLLEAIKLINERLLAILKLMNVELDDKSETKSIIETVNKVLESRKNDDEKKDGFEKEIDEMNSLLPILEDLQHKYEDDEIEKIALKTKKEQEETSNVLSQLNIGDLVKDLLGVKKGDNNNNQGENGVTTIGFGNDDKGESKDESKNDDVNVVSVKKRKIEDTDIETNLPDSKKLKSQN